MKKPKIDFRMLILSVTHTRRGLVRTEVIYKEKKTFNQCLLSTYYVTVCVEGNEDTEWSGIQALAPCFCLIAFSLICF